MYFFRNESVINIMIDTPESLFVESVGTEDERHTGEYIAERRRAS